MALKRRRFTRPLGERRYKRRFLIAAEGTKTEPIYFSLLNDTNAVIQVSCLKGKHDSSPPDVLKRMTNYLKKEGLKKSDEAWLIVDKDHWTNTQLLQLHEWSMQRENYGFALSNPKFEYWLLLHFEDGLGVSTSKDCTDRLKRWLPNFDKGFDTSKISLEKINDAIRRAKIRDNPPCLDWPRRIGQTTVYRLLERVVNL